MVRSKERRGWAGLAGGWGWEISLSFLRTWWDGYFSKPKRSQLHNLVFLHSWVLSLLLKLLSLSSLDNLGWALSEPASLHTSYLSRLLSMLGWHLPAPQGQWLPSAHWSDQFRFWVRSWGQGGCQPSPMNRLKWSYMLGGGTYKAWLMGMSTWEILVCSRQVGEQKQRILSRKITW